MTRRERITIMGVILEEIARGASEPGGPRLTRIAMRTNLAYDRFHEMFLELERKGLVQSGPPVSLTPAGRDVLDKYRGLNAALQGLGLGPPAPHDPPGMHEP